MVQGNVFCGCLSYGVDFLHIGSTCAESSVLYFSYQGPGSILYNYSTQQFSFNQKTEFSFSNTSSSSSYGVTSTVVHSTATTTELANFYAPAITKSSGTLTRTAGMRIGVGSAGINNYGLYITHGHASNIGIFIQGSALQSGDYLQIKDSDNTTIFSIDYIGRPRPGSSYLTSFGNVGTSNQVTFNDANGNPWTIVVEDGIVIGLNSAGG